MNRAASSQGLPESSEALWPWWKTGVVYQVYPRSFRDSDGDGIGDLRGLIEKLDYLNDGTPDSLGVDAIWCNPFFPSPQRDFGYDVSDYTAVDPVYGTMNDFDELVAEAHRRGIRIILDLVVNHTSNLHPWFIESRSSRENSRRDWYIWRDGRGRFGGGRETRGRGPGLPPSNWRGEFGGSAWTWDARTEQWYMTSFLPEQVDLNLANPAVRGAVRDIMRFWLDRGADGFRLDVAHLYGKDPDRDNPPFWRRRRGVLRQPFGDRPFLTAVMQELGLPSLQDKFHGRNHPVTHTVLREMRQVLDSYDGPMAVGEIMADGVEELAGYFGRSAGGKAGENEGVKAGDELHLAFNFEFTSCRWGAGPFARAVERWEGALPGWGWPCYTLSNHDIPRHRSRYERRGAAAARAALAGAGTAVADRRARLAAMMLLTLRGTPFLYYGEEIGMKEARVPRHLIQDPVGKRFWPFHPGRDGCRTPMQWTGEPGAGFTGGEPWLPLGPDFEVRNVEAQKADTGSLLSFYRRLIWLRKSLPALTVGTYANLAHLTGVPAGCFAYLRQEGGQTLAVVLNFSSALRTIRLPLGRDAGGARANAPERGGAPPNRILMSTAPGREGQRVEDALELAPEEGCLVELSRGGTSGM
ncbi:MAG: DUF3459 domain-containing protein [Bacillota bacterium]|nr:MAG: DUF3459 domain-containing protein [Bacillota bacterium]